MMFRKGDRVKWTGESMENIAPMTGTVDEDSDNKPTARVRWDFDPADSHAEFVVFLERIEQ